MTRRLRARVAFPAEVRVESFAPPPRDKDREWMLALGLDPDKHTITGRSSARTPPIQWPRTEFVIIDDPITRPFQKLALEEARAWWDGTVKERFGVPVIQRPGPFGAGSLVMRRILEIVERLK